MTRAVLHKIKQSVEFDQWLAETAILCVETLLKNAEERERFFAKNTPESLTKRISEEINPRMERILVEGRPERPMAQSAWRDPRFLVKSSTGINEFVRYEIVEPYFRKSGNDPREKGMRKKVRDTSEALVREIIFTLNRQIIAVHR